MQRGMHARCDAARAAAQHERERESGTSFAPSPTDLRRLSERRRQRDEKSVPSSPGEALDCVARSRGKREVKVALGMFCVDFWACSRAWTVLRLNRVVLFEFVCCVRAPIGFVSRLLQCALSTSNFRGSQCAPETSTNKAFARVTRHSN